MVFIRKPPFLSYPDPEIGNTTADFFTLKYNSAKIYISCLITKNGETDMAAVRRKGLVIVLVFAVIFSQFMIFGTDSAQAASEGDKINVLATRELYFDKSEYTHSYSFSISKSMMLMFPVDLFAWEGNKVGRVRFALTDSRGNAVFTKVLDLSDAYYYNKWFYSGTQFIKAGKYKITITSLDKRRFHLKFSIRGYRQSATTASISKAITSRSNNWVKLGRITNGLPYLASTYSTNRSFVRNVYADKDGYVYAFCRAKGEASITVKLKNGKKFTTKVTVKAGDPNFLAMVTKHNATNKYFDVKIKNAAAKTVYIYKEGTIRDIDDNTPCRNIKKNATPVAIKTGETKYVRFYYDGKSLDPNNEFYMLESLKFKYEGNTYKWSVDRFDSEFLRSASYRKKTYVDRSEYTYFSA